IAASWSEPHADGEPEGAAARILRDLDIARYGLDPEVAHLRVHPCVVAASHDDQVAPADADAPIPRARPRDEGRGQRVAERDLPQLEVRGALDVRRSPPPPPARDAGGPAGAGPAGPLENGGEVELV